MIELLQCIGKWGKSHRYGCRTTQAETKSLYSYSVFRRVVDYYSDNPTSKSAGEDAFDMRKPMKRDKKRKHIRENGEEYRINPEDIYHA